MKIHFSNDEETLIFNKTKELIDKALSTPELKEYLSNVILIEFLSIMIKIKVSNQEEIGSNDNLKLKTCTIYIKYTFTLDSSTGESINLPIRYTETTFWDNINTALSQYILDLKQINPSTNYKSLWV